MPNMLIGIASRQLAAVHSYLSTTEERFHNHTITMYIGKLC